MTRDEFSKGLGKHINNALQGGCHQLDIVATLEAHKFNLLLLTHEQGKPKIVRPMFPLDGKEGN